MTYNGFLITVRNGIYYASWRDVQVIAESKDALFEMLDAMEDAWKRN